MANQDIIDKLRSLTSQQKKVLKGVCEGKPYKVIAKELFLSIETIKTHMGNVYLKLGLMDLPPTLRRKIIFEEYWPVFKEFDFDTSIIYQDEPDDTEEPEPVPEEVIEIVEKDELALMVIKPEVIDIPGYDDEQPYRPNLSKTKNIQENQKKDKGKKKRRAWRWMLFIMIIALLVFGGMQVYSWARGFLNDVVVPMISQETPEMIPTQNIVQPTHQPIIIPTEAVVIVPTNTFLPPTPQPTQTLSPKINLPFFDDFSNGISSPWSVGSGNWFVTDSGASISISDVYDDAGSIIIDDPTLTDYKLRVRVHTPHIFAPSQGQFGVVVRYSSTKDQNIILYMDSNARFRWAYIEGLNDLSFYQPPITGVDKRGLGDTDVTLEIEVSGNSFTARVDGAKVDQFSMTGYENGGFALITSCGSIGSCPSFSDLSIEPIN
jgi:hypothetical protein